MHPALNAFSPPSAQWFSTAFDSPTPPQVEGWPAIASGDHTLILAPTGTGKTLTAFFWGLDQLITNSRPESKNHRTRILYISPLRALAVDVEKNLREPLAGIGQAAERLDQPFHEPQVALRTGDTPPDARRRLANNPPDLLITTPESLFLMLTSRVRETLAGVTSVIIDEIHSLAATKRGAHLSLSLERLDRLVDRPVQRIGLSATQRPLEEVARFLGGYSGGKPRPVTIVDTGITKQLEIEVVVPVEDMAEPGDSAASPPTQPDSAKDGPKVNSIWPSIHPALLDLINSHQSTIIFVNARRLAERLATRLNELAVDGTNRAAEGTGQPPDGDGSPEGYWGDVGSGGELVMAHHGSLSREQRLIVEDRLKRGDLKALVATSSLELGIDMGAVDLVIQVESPGAVSRGLQRVGRAGHQVGAPSRGKFFPKHRADLVETAVVIERMASGLIERTRYPRNPIDVLAQQIVATVALDDWSIDDLAAMVRGSANFADLSDEVLEATIDLLAGRYPSDEFAELRPRVIWNRVEGTIRGRPGAQRLAVTSGGTIPDRGLYGVFLADRTRVGELDEEMVYESRPGETFLLGASTWRITEITHDRVIVVPAPGQPGRMPFWHGDGPGRPAELGRALGAFAREINATSREEAVKRLQSQNGLDRLAASNLLKFFDDQLASTGHLPDDKTILIERFVDEIGDWRVCVLSPFGAQVHAPWGIALKRRLRDKWGLEVEMQWSDDGIVLRLPEAVDQFPSDELAIAPEELDELLVAELPSTALFAARFRECAARALLLPRRRPDRRTPLWQQRQKAADLLAVAARHPRFPILAETSRECLNDVFDVPGLRAILAEIKARRIKLVTVDTPTASPFAQSLIFGWIAQYMYEGDAPLAERRAAALSLDRELLADLLGSEELRELLDADVMAGLEAELQRTADDWRATSVDGVDDLLRWLGPLSTDELQLRVDVETTGTSLNDMLARLVADNRIAQIDSPDAGPDDESGKEPGTQRWASIDELDSNVERLARFARTNVPFVTRQAARSLGLSEHDVEAALGELEESGRVVKGEFRPDGVEREWCDRKVLAVIRRRSLAALRQEVEPVEPEVLARFLPKWQHVGSRLVGIDGLAEVITCLQGAALPISALESAILPVRIRDYQPAHLDSLLGEGELLWVGAGSLRADDGRVRLLWRDQAQPLLASTNAPEINGIADPDETDGPQGEKRMLRQALLGYLKQSGASFWPDLVAAAHAAGCDYSDDVVNTALWELVWAGEVTNDGFAPVRAWAASSKGGSRSTRRSSTNRSTVRRSRGRRAGNRAALRGPSPFGPPTAAGRWAPVLMNSRATAPTPTEATMARAVQLLERYGVLTREMALAEGLEGGFAGVYPVLKEMEERGQARRGYFVAGLGAAQFALAGAVDQLRDERRATLRPPPAANPDESPVVVLAATDPAQPYGAAVPWPSAPSRTSRSVGAWVVLDHGRPVVFLERGGRSLTVFDEAMRSLDDLAVNGMTGRWVAALASLVDRGWIDGIEISKANGNSIAEEPKIKQVLLAGGFRAGYRGPTLKS